MDLGAQPLQEQGILDETFVAENHEYDAVPNASYRESPDVSRIIGNGANISNSSGIDGLGCTTSSRNGISRRTSQRQAAKRARMEKLPSLQEEDPSLPRILSPMSSPDTSAGSTQPSSGPAEPSTVPSQPSTGSAQPSRLNQTTLNNTNPFKVKLRIN